MSLALRRLASEVGDAYVVSLVRAVLGVLLALNALREVGDLVSGGYFGDGFHVPIVPEALVPSRPVFALLVALECVLAALVTAGRRARESLLASSLIGIYLLLCDRARYHNNRYALLLFAFLLAFAPCDRAFVAWRPPMSDSDRIGPLFAQQLAKLQIAIIYLASGGSKLLDPDWRSGLVIGDRLARSMALAVSKGVPIEAMRFLSQPAVAEVLSKLAISTELFLAIALFWPRTRAFALWWGVWFHVTIEVTSKVELFGWLTITMFALFAQPTLRERAFLYDPSRGSARAAARLIRALDWLARFEIRAAEAPSEHAVVVVDRDGSSRVGLAAVAAVARAIPLLFPLSMPLLLLSRSGRPR